MAALSGIEQARRVVVKVGSALLIAADGKGVDTAWLAAFAAVNTNVSAASPTLRQPITVTG